MSVVLDQTSARIAIVEPDWQPTGANINALPYPLRSFIHDLATKCDPTGDIQTIWSQREQIGGLLNRVRELEGEQGEDAARTVEDVVHDILIGSTVVRHVPMDDVRRIAKDIGEQFVGRCVTRAA